MTAEVLTDDELTRLTVFLSNVEEHRHCPVRYKQRGNCLRVILAKFERYKINDILEKLERQLYSGGDPRNE